VVLGYHVILLALAFVSLFLCVVLQRAGKLVRGMKCRCELQTQKAHDRGLDFHGESKCAMASSCMVGELAIHHTKDVSDFALGYPRYRGERDGGEDFGDHSGWAQVVPLRAN
jgi:hypothetical protein